MPRNAANGKQFSGAPRASGAQTDSRRPPEKQAGSGRDLSACGIQKVTVHAEVGHLPAHTHPHARALPAVSQSRRACFYQRFSFPTDCFNDGSTHSDDSTEVGLLGWDFASFSVANEKVCGYT